MFFTFEKGWANINTIFYNLFGSFCTIYDLSSLSIKTKFWSLYSQVFPNPHLLFVCFLWIYSRIARWKTQKQTVNTFLTYSINNNQQNNNRAIDKEIIEKINNQSSEPKFNKSNKVI